MVAVAIMWLTTSRTLHPEHSDGLLQLTSGSAPSASTSDARSSLVICHVSTALLR